MVPAISAARTGFQSAEFSVAPELPMGISLETRFFFTVEAERLLRQGHVSYNHHLERTVQDVSASHTQPHCYP